ncbi:hypothetical protein N0V94_007513 [Neodidymelliopsis sp. IMI 364377]|nr:hypothetical protein N0V94_007513 [Neodidymelliopsis sp. IMI 364377]
MALVRSLLRTQRLQENENLLRTREFQGQIQGHELDWQTLQIERDIIKSAEGALPVIASSAYLSDDTYSDNKLSWSIVERPSKLEDHQVSGFRTMLIAQLARNNLEIAMNKDNSTAWTSYPQTNAGDEDEWEGKCANALTEWIARIEDTDPACTSPQPNVAKKLLSYRSRFSHLTHDDAPTTDQRWGLEVRDQAAKLQTAIQSVANYVFSDARQADMDAQCDTTAAFCWAMNCKTAQRPSTIVHPVHLMVRRVRGQWRIDICQLEAILGLWTWSIKMDVEKHKQEEKELAAETSYESELELDIEETREMEAIDYDRIFSKKVFTVVTSQDPEVRKRAERELDIWVLREQRQPVYEKLDKQVLADLEGPKQADKASPILSLPTTRNLLMRSNSIQQQDQGLQDARMLAIQTGNSVLVMATQDIFTSFVDALASVTSALKGVNIVQTLRGGSMVEEVISVSNSRPFLGLSHDHTDRLVDLFTQAGLGSREDALLSVIPPFHSRSLLPSLRSEYEQLRSHAQKFKKNLSWEQAENILKALFDEVASNMQHTDASNMSEELLRDLGELYRKAMMSENLSRRSFGYHGVYNMLTTCAEQPNKHNNAKEIMQNYNWVAKQLAELQGDNIKIVADLQAKCKKTHGFLVAEISMQDIMRQASTYPYGLVMAELFKKQTENERKSLGPQLLIWAAQRDCGELVEDMLAAGMNVNIRDEKHRTPLSYACEKGYDELSEVLIESGATVIADEENRSPLTWAAISGRYRVVRQLLKINIDVDLQDRVHWRTPLSWAAGNGHKAVVELLLETDRVDVGTKDRKQKRTPLSFAAENGHEVVVQLLLQAINVDVEAKGGEMNQTPLSFAAENGHEAVVKLLLEIGRADVESKDANRLTPLSWAAKNGHEAVVKLLLKIGRANVELKGSFKQTPLSFAAENGHEAVVKLLLEISRADIESKALNEQTPLSLAAENGYEAVVKLLLEIGRADVESKDANGLTPLSWAAKNGHEAVVKLLLEIGRANVELEGSFNQTPLSFAAENGHEAVVKLLLKIGRANVESKASNGQTPLSWAARNGHGAVTKLLLEIGRADVESKDAKGQTPLVWAHKGLMSGHTAVKLLLKASKVGDKLED